jgi:hypothetical protein
MRPEPYNPKLATRALQNAGPAKPFKDKTAPGADQRLCCGPRRKAGGIDTRGAGGGGFSPRRACRSAERANSTRRRRRHASDQARAGLIKRMPDANVTKDTPNE